MKSTELLRPSRRLVQPEVRYRVYEEERRQGLLQGTIRNQMSRTDAELTPNSSLIFVRILGRRSKNAVRATLRSTDWIHLDRAILVTVDRYPNGRLLIASKIGSSSTDTECSVYRWDDCVCQAVSDCRSGRVGQ